MAYWSGPLTILGLTYPNYAKQVDLTPNNLTPSLVAFEGRTTPGTAGI